MATLSAAELRGRKAYQRHPSFTRYTGQPLDPGELFTLQGLANDETLVRLGYAVLADPKAKGLRCRVCAREFVSENARNQHGHRTHRETTQVVERAPRREDLDDPGLELARMDESEDLPADAPPLYLDQTSEARGVKPQASA